MRRQVILAAALGLFAAGAAEAQSRWPMIVQRVIPGTRDQAPPPLAGIDALRAEFLARSGSDLVYFSGDSAVLSPQSKATLGAQAMWLRQHPEVVARVEGDAELGDTRDHALALGARRAQEVRDYLILMGVPPAQLTVTSWGKERPGPPRTQTILVR